jgi:hypothetical protein
VAVVSFLPFARGFLAGRAFFFRDLSRQFIPLRLWALEGLRHGELRYWLPLVHEGTPAPFPPVSYPLELLQLLAPHESGVSLFLALHVPLAAAMFMLLARGIGLGIAGAAGGALIFALGGFALSSLNLYVHLLALAWSPLVVHTLRRAADGGPRRVLAAALATALCLSTSGAEIALQAVVLGLILAAGRPAPLRRLALGTGACLMAVALAAPTVLVMAGVVGQSVRAGGGFTTDVVLTHSVHPVSLAQVFIGDFHGDLGDFANTYWGENLFPTGFPYVLSLYLGATAMALAAVGARHGASPRRRVAIAGVCALFVCLGRWVGWWPLVDAIPLLHKVRYPVKAFFTVHFAVALLAAQGLDGLQRGARETWRSLAEWCLLLGGSLLVVCLLPRLAPEATRWFLLGYMPWDDPWPTRYRHLAAMVASAAAGGSLAVVAGSAALATCRGRLRPARGAAAVLALLAADLVRTGAGLNPMVTARFYGLSPETTALVRPLAGNPEARIHTCEPTLSAAYWMGWRIHYGRHDIWTFELYRQALAPFGNVVDGVATGLSQDMTGLVAEQFVQGPDDNCRQFARLAPRLRAAGVTHVLSIEPLDDAALKPAGRAAPARLAPVELFLHELVAPAPMAYLATASAAQNDSSADRHVHFGPRRAGRISLGVSSPEAALLVVRETAAAGWHARVNGRPATVEQANHGHLAVRVPAGRSDVVFDYRPPGLAAGLAMLGIGCLVAAILRYSDRRPSPARSADGASPAGDARA